MNMNMVKRVVQLSLYAERARIMEYYNDAWHDTDYRQDAIESTVYGLMEGADNMVADALYRYSWYPTQNSDMSENEISDLYWLIENYVGEITK